MKKAIITLAIVLSASFAHAENSCDKIGAVTLAQIDALLIGLGYKNSQICGETDGEPNACTLNQKKLFINKLIWEWAKENFKRGKEIQNNIEFNAQFQGLAD